ncbi:MAG: UBP-type zinc finger domain-containing protein [Pseudomonadota bacterium]
MARCGHLITINQVTPQSPGCAECLESGSWWVHLRVCRSCGHVGCCDDSPNKHATAHFQATRHPIIEGYDPPEGWGWCFVEQVEVDLPDTTPQPGQIPRFIDADGRIILSAIRGLKPAV